MSLLKGKLKKKPVQRKCKCECNCIYSKMIISNHQRQLFASKSGTHQTPVSRLLDTDSSTDHRWQHFSLSRGQRLIFSSPPPSYSITKITFNDFVLNDDELKSGNIKHCSTKYTQTHTNTKLYQFVQKLFKILNNI